MKTKSEAIAADVCALLRARNPLLWVVTREESRVEGHLTEAAAAAGYVTRTWDCGQGVATGGKVERLGGKDPSETMTMIATRAEKGRELAGADRCAWIMRDLPVWLKAPQELRQLRNLARMLPSVPRDSAQAIIVLSPSGDVPPELVNHATVIEWPLPDRTEIDAILEASVNNLPEEIDGVAIRAPALEALNTNGQRDASIDAAVGLSGEEAQTCYARSLVQSRRIDAGMVAREKKRVITRDKLLEWFDPLPGGLESVGGLENLKSWLKSRSSAYSSEARDYGLPLPKGCLVVGVPGCGKSMLAKACATWWRVPLLKLDLGAIKSEFVGKSERRLRDALGIVDAVGRCVVWLDEIEKALQGATSGSADGGVSSDALGAILNWTQERRSAAFLFATANKAWTLPEELVRKGRWDETWSVDLPDSRERVAILQATLKTHNRGDIGIDCARVAAVCDKYTGSELAAIVTDAMFAAFNDARREITTEDLIAAARTVVPLSTTAAEGIDKLRNWCKGRARPASLTEQSADSGIGGTRRQLDF